MEIRHERWLPQPPDAVWQALNDPEVLGACMPGCESVERLAPDYFVAYLVARVGPVEARVEGTIRIVDPRPPRHYTLAFEASGRAFGRTEGRTYVELVDDRGGARITYRVALSMSGRLARMGQRFLNSAALRLMDRFFDRLAERLREGV
jgi:carbon monoxide dehydrogenase subunit G